MLLACFKTLAGKEDNYLISECCLLHKLTGLETTLCMLLHTNKE